MIERFRTHGFTLHFAGKFILDVATAEALVNALEDLRRIEERGAV